MTGGATMSEGVRNNTAESRFELDADGHTALAFYRTEPGVITFVHTEVPQELSGRGVGSRLIRGALEQVRALGLKVVAKCPFVSGYLGKHPEFNDLLR
jgi:predicted GNAT family acetyltransferase